MNIDLIYYNFSLKYDSIDSKVKRNIDAAQFDEIINAAVRYFIKNNYAGYKSVGFEVSQANFDKLSNLVIKSPSVQPSLPVGSIAGTNIYEFFLEDLEYEYFHMIRASISVSECDDLIALDITQHDDLDHVLHNEFKRPSLRWRRGVATFGRNSTSASPSLYVYSAGEFTPNGLLIEYIKAPQEASIGGYLDINGNAKIKTELDISENYHDEIIDIAVKIASGIIPHQGRFQTANEILTNTD